MNGLMEIIGTAFRAKYKVNRLQYIRGEEHIAVERLVPEDEVPEAQKDNTYLTAFEMARQHAELFDELEQKDGEDILRLIARAIQHLAINGFTATAFLVQTRVGIADFVGRDISLDMVWHIPLIEESELDSNVLLITGSRTSSLIRDIEAAVFCRFSE